MTTTHLPRTLLEPHPDNRKQFDAAALAELHADIAARGVLDDLIVRPIAGRDGSDGRPLYQILSGERRWRASDGTPSADALPCKVRECSDLEALELVLVPNIQRENLHPLDEAACYERLLLEPPAWARAGGPPRLAGYTIEQLADRVHKSRRHIHARLRLLGLNATARHAFLDDAFGIGSALQIARLNTQHQEELVQALLNDASRGAAWSAEAVSHMVQSRYMLRLAGAPFDLRDAELVAAAGACATCPKRSGTDPELFDDIAEGDTCTDRACFATKCAAHTLRAIERAQAKGWTVIGGDEAARLLPRPDGTVKGYLRLDRPSEFALSNKPLGEVLGADGLRDVAIIVRSLGDDRPTAIVEVMPTAVVRQALKAKGLLREETKAESREKKPAPAKKKTQPPADAETRPPAAAAIDDPVLAEALSGLTVFSPDDMLHKGKPKAPDASVLKRRTEWAVTEARRIMALHRIGLRLREAGTGGFPVGGLIHLVAASVESWLDSTTVRHCAAMAGVAAENGLDDRAKRNYARPSPIFDLDEESAARMAIMLLAAQTEIVGLEAAEAATIVARALDVDLADIEQLAKDLVNERARLELLAVAPPVVQKAAAKPLKAART